MCVCVCGWGGGDIKSPNLLVSFIVNVTYSLMYHDIVC